ncbi:hypothetical protein [Lentzea guizhouensis]|uniref:hypothetical protein n=1 Tax=Lentzea guizhouensis TaxID=1586287 RepID=UPI00300299F4
MVITGTGGVGKTSLAVHWAHHNASRFPDGQLYVNLHGFGPSRAVSPGDALLRFLAALDVPRARVPHDLAGQSELLRETVRGKRILLLLDNAADVAQVEPLLPRSRGSHVVVTSRAALTPLPDAHPVALGLLPPTTPASCWRAGSAGTGGSGAGSARHGGAPVRGCRSRWRWRAPVPRRSRSSRWRRWPTSSRTWTRSPTTMTSQRICGRCSRTRATR